MVSVWNTHGLDGLVRGRRTNQSTDFATLFDTMAAPGCPFPYVVFEQSRGSRRSHMSWSLTEGRELRDVVWRFVVRAANKGTAAEIAGVIMDVYENECLTLDVGSVILIQHGADWGVREAEDEWAWVLDYEVLFDAVTKT